jgi:hypothetical protein
MKLIQQVEEAASFDSSEISKDLNKKFTSLSQIEKQDFVKKVFLIGDYWGIISLILTFVKVFTGKKADAKIDEILSWGNGLFKKQ